MSAIVTTFSMSRSPWAQGGSAVSNKSTAPWMAKPMPTRAKNVLQLPNWIIQKRRHVRIVLVYTLASNWLYKEKSYFPMFDIETHTHTPFGQTTRQNASAIPRSANPGGKMHNIVLRRILARKCNWSKRWGCQWTWKEPCSHTLRVTRVHSISAS